LLSAPTGAGKSTWLPLQILRDGNISGKIILLEPRRLAARNVAQRLAELLTLPLDAVSVKATTSEGLGFTGRGEGLAAQAAVSVELPG